MKALTIIQPFPELILRGLKLVENRDWPTSYRGPLLIHAGKSRDWLEIANRGNGDFDRQYGIPLSEMAFGAIVGRCMLIDCVHLEDYKAHQKYPWLREHHHANGPWCWIMLDAVRLAKPIPYRGALGLFEVPNSVIAEAT